MHGCYCVPARSGALWRPLNPTTRQNQSRRKADKESLRVREGSESRPDSMKLPERRRCVKRCTAGSCAKGNLRGQRSDPWHGANAPPKVVADPAQMVETRKRNHERVSTWSAGRWRNHQPMRAQRPHSKSRAREPLDGPATRPNELRWPWRIASGSRQPIGRLMSARERERGELPPPLWPLSDRKVGQGLLL